MKAILAQDWLHLRGPNAGDTVLQPEVAWVDLCDHREVVAWLEVRQLSISGGAATVNVQYQTAPSKEEDLLTQIAVVTPSSGVTTITTFVPESAPLGPVARWFRWLAVSTAGPWEIEFRLWLAVASHGCRYRKGD